MLTADVGQPLHITPACELPGADQSTGHPLPPRTLPRLRGSCHPCRDAALCCPQRERRCCPHGLGGAAPSSPHARPEHSPAHPRNAFAAPARAAFDQTSGARPGQADAGRPSSQGHRHRRLRGGGRRTASSLVQAGEGRPSEHSPTRGGRSGRLAPGEGADTRPPPRGRTQPVRDRSPRGVETLTRSPVPLLETARRCFSSPGGRRPRTFLKQGAGNCASSHL